MTNTNQSYFRHFRKARKNAYTTKNIKAAFEVTGIVPFNPRRVLGRFTGTAKADPLTTPKHKTSIRVVHIPPTPSNNRQVRYVHQQALQRAKDPILCSLIDKLANAAIGSLVKEYLSEDWLVQLQAAWALKEDNKDRKRTKLSEAKAITGEELLRLRLEKLALESAPKARRKQVAFTGDSESEESDEGSNVSEASITASEGSTIYVHTPATHTPIRRPTKSLMPNQKPQQLFGSTETSARATGASKAEGSTRRVLRPRGN